MLQNIKSVICLFSMFPDEQACIDYLEHIRWGSLVTSPFDQYSKVYKCKNNKYYCTRTNKYFNVKTKTFLENTKVSLQKWFFAIWLVTSYKKGISSLQLGREIGVTQKTAWIMLNKIREAFSLNTDCEQVDGEVEIDETFVGGKNKNRHKDKKVKNCQGRSFKDKTPVFGILQRKGKVRTIVVPDTKVKTLNPIIKGCIKPGSTLYTDEWNYGDINCLYNHKNVNHSAHFYASGDLHTNSIEGFWSIAKRSVNGTYHYISKKHMQGYFDEFSFRYNTRNISSFERFNLFLSYI